LKTVDSPVLKRAGATQNEFERGGYPVPNMGEFTTLKQTWQQRKTGAYKEEDGKEILPGFKGQYHA
jgi:hypothetical protein